MLIADTSAWVEWLRRTESPADLAFDRAFAAGEVRLAEPVRAELLFGARSRADAARLLRLLDSVELAFVAPRDDFEAAVTLHLGARRMGVSVRGLLDCLVVAMATRLEMPVLHHDRDIARLAAVAGVDEVEGSLRLT